MLAELPFIPGVVKDEEPYSARGAAIDSQLIRWVRGKPETMGGWTSVLSGIEGKVRAMHEWTLTDGRPYLAIGTSSNLYIFDGSRVLDITPERHRSALGAAPLATINGSPTVTITDTGHGARAGDRVYLNGATTVAGLTIGGANVNGLSNPITTTAGSKVVIVTDAAHGLANNDIIQFSLVAPVGGIASGFFDPSFRVLVLGPDTFQIELEVAATSSAVGGGTVDYIQYKPYRITSVINANSYRINAGANANATTTGGGSIMGAVYDINVGPESSGILGGYGGGTYGSGVYGGTAATLIDTTPIPLRQWSLDNFGNNLVACLSGGTDVEGDTVSIFIWPFIAYYGYRATPLQNAPVQVTCIVTTPERFLLACGCTNEDGDFDPMLVRHTTGEDPTVWVASALNSAGDFPVSGGSRIVGTVRRETGPMIFTDGGLNAVRTVGEADQIYKAEQVGVDCGLLAMHAGTQRDGDLYWVSPAYQFYVYRGGRPTAIECPCREWFEGRVVKLQSDKVFAWPDRRFEAVSFHYPADPAVGEPGDYLRIDVPESRRDPKAGWSVGRMDRTACSAGYVFAAKKPLAVSSAGVLYQHEDGFSDNGTAHETFVQWAPIDLADGQTAVGVNRAQLDMTLSETVTVLLGFREWPKGPVGSRQLLVRPNTQKNDTQGRGRQVDMRVGLVGTTYWRLGTTRVNLTEGPRR